MVYYYAICQLRVVDARSVSLSRSSQAILYKLHHHVMVISEGVKTLVHQVMPSNLPF